MFFNKDDHGALERSILREVDERIANAILPLLNQIAALEKDNERLCKLMELFKEDLKTTTEELKNIFKDHAERMHNTYEEGLNEHEEEHKSFEIEHKKWHDDAQRLSEKRHDQYEARMAHIVQNSNIQTETLVDLAALFREFIHKVDVSVKKPKAKKNADHK